MLQVRIFMFQIRISMLQVRYVTSPDFHVTNPASPLSFSLPFYLTCPIENGAPTTPTLTWGNLAFLNPKEEEFLFVVKETAGLRRRRKEIAILDGERVIG